MTLGQRCWAGWVWEGTWLRAGGREGEREDDPCTGANEKAAPLAAREEACDLQGGGLLLSRDGVVSWRGVRVCVWEGGGDHKLLVHKECCIAGLKACFIKQKQDCLGKPTSNIENKCCEHIHGL